jgi:hypothetical protein
VYKTIILPVVLYRCETWSFTPRRKIGPGYLKVSENMVVRKILRPKRKEVKGEREKLHNEELHDLYSSRNIVRMTK